MSPTSSISRRRWILAIASIVIVAPTNWTPACAQPSSEANVVPLTVRTPHSGFNRLVVSVTVCVPGTERCATIDDVMVDTGSTGLRLEASAVPPFLDLPAFAGADGKPLAECLRFVHDDAWGPLHRADVRIGGMTARDIPVQVIADDLRPKAAGCPTSTAMPTSNGTLGIGQHLLDCQGACTQREDRPGVFIHDDGVWLPVYGSVPIEDRLPNPVSRFPQHGNGVVIDIPASPDSGAEKIVGTLTFGVGTAPNNQPGAHLIRLDTKGLITTRYGGADYPASYIDSGTETYILADEALPRCVGMEWAFCVSPARALTATMVGTDGAEVQVPFRIGDYRGALNGHVGAWDGFAEVAEPGSKAFVWGAPFFLGRRVALVFDGMSVGGARGPFYALP